MFFDKTTFIGIDPTSGQKPFTYAALDGDLQLLALGQGQLDEVLAFVGGQQSAYLGINAPQQPNQGKMSEREVRSLLDPPPRSGRWKGFRVAEYELHSRGISIPRTPAVEEECPRWVQVGFHLYRGITRLGYVPYPGEPALSGDLRSPVAGGGGVHQFIEVYPHGAFAALLGLIPFPKHTLEGRIQRQLVLYLEEVNISNPMQIFEEITRHRLLQGILPLEGLHTVVELDALMAAYTAWMAATKSEEVSLVGHPEEGQIVMPVAELKIHYA